MTHRELLRAISTAINRQKSTVIAEYDDRPPYYVQLKLAAGFGVGHNVGIIRINESTTHVILAHHHHVNACDETSYELANPNSFDLKTIVHDTIDKFCGSQNHVSSTNLGDLLRKAGFNE